MDCPGCHMPLREAAEVCERCGYGAAAAMERFPYAAPELEGVMDPGGVLGERGRRALAEQVRQLEGRFPQVGFYCCVAPLAEGVDVREFGFWLFNASTPRTAAEHERRWRGMLLVVDTGGRRASLTVGYQLDPLLSDGALELALKAGEREFRAGRHGEGATRVLQHLQRQLEEAHRALQMLRRAPAGCGQTHQLDELTLAESHGW